MRRSPGDGTLFKRKDGLWVGGVEMPAGPDGTRKMKRVTSKDRNKCIKKLRKLKDAMAAGEVPTAPSTTVARWLEFWAQDILPARGIKPSTITTYEGIVRRQLIPRIGAKRLDRLRTADVRQLYADITTAVSGREAQKADQVLRLALKAAVRDGVIGVNIMDRVDKPQHVKREGTALDAVTAGHIIATAAKVQGTMWAARWAAGFLTGARESEVLGLEWDRVDLERGICDISWQLQRLPKIHGCGQPVDKAYPCGRTRPSFCPRAVWRYPRGDFRPIAHSLAWTRPKTLAGKRLIPIVPPLVDILRTIEHDEPNPHGLVFHMPDGRPIDQETDQEAWRALLIAAEVPHVPQHSIRHSTATLLMESHADPHVIQSVIGHSDIATLRGYQHVSLDLARAAWGSLSAILPPPEG